MFSEKTKAEFIKYVNTIITNTAKDCYKKIKKKLQTEIPLDEISEVFFSNMIEEDTSFSLSKGYENIEDVFSNIKFYNAMKKLSNREKEVLALFVIEELSAKEIAKKLNISDNLVFQIYSRSKIKFIKYLNEEE